MARFKKSRRSRGGGGLMAMVKPFAVGALAGYANKTLGVPQVIPYQGVAAGAAGAYALGSRGTTGLLAGAAGGFAGDMFAGGSSGSTSEIKLN